MSTGMCFPSQQFSDFHSHCWPFPRGHLLPVNEMFFPLAILTALACRPALAAADPADFDWATVPPSVSLNYTACYGDHKCSKLLLPLDWTDQEGSEARVALAVIVRPAVVDESDPSFGGTIIVNPGGPSGSGVSYVLKAGEIIQRTADGNKKFEILSFDPRGVGFTTPSSDCHHNEFARANAIREDRAIGSLDETVTVLRRKMSRAVAFGNLCHQESPETDIRKYMSTASVARDMVEIVDKIDELRHGYGHNQEPAKSDTAQHAGNRLELRSSAHRSVPRIQYWGVSYGTVLGNYFASMFPGRVGRMILEAVEDPEDYTDGVQYTNQIRPIAFQI